MSLKRVVKKIESITKNSAIELKDYFGIIEIEIDKTDIEVTRDLSDYVIENMKKLNRYFSDIDCDIDKFKNVVFRFCLKEKALRKLSDTKTASSKQMQKSYYNYLQKNNQATTILQYAKYVNDYQYTTDSFIACKLVKEDHNKLFADEKEQNNYNYPAIEKCFPISCEYSFKVEYSVLVNNIKIAIAQKKLLLLVLKENDKLIIDPNRLKKLFDGMQLTDDRFCIHYCDDYKPLLVFEKINGSLGLILPIKQPDIIKLEDFVIIECC